MRNNKDDVIEDAKSAIELSSLSEIDEARIKDIEKQYDALSDRLNQLAGSNVGANADIYDSTIKQLNYEQGILQTEWEQLMEKKQKSVSMERQLLTLLEILDELDDDPDNPDFRDDIFQQIVHRGIMQPDGEVDFELKCGATIPAKAFVRATTWNWKAK